MTLILALLIGGIPVSFEDSSQSPFTQADRRGDYPVKNSIESKVNDQFGLVIQPTKALDESFYNDVIGHLQKSSLRAVVYQDSLQHFVACTPQGEPLDQSHLDIPPSLFQSIKVGEIAILIQEPRDRSKLWGFWFQGNLVNEKYEENFHYGWFNLGPKIAAIQDVRIKFKKSEYMGDIGKAVGSTAYYGATSFSVLNRHDSDTTGSNWIDISVSKMDSPVTFDFQNSIDLKKIMKEIGPSFSFGLDTTGSYTRKMPENQWTYRLTSEVPVDYWDKIHIVRDTSVSCYFRHIVTEPTKK